jgi:TolB-like protein
MKNQETVKREQGTVQEKRKETDSLKISKSKSQKRIILARGALLLAAIIFISLIVFNIIGVGKKAKTGSIESILILPFGNYTGDEALEPLVSGMHSTLISEIQRLSGLRVICKKSSDAFKNTDMTVHEIARKMNVDAVIEPSVLCWGDSVCTTFTMVSGDRKEEQLWIGDYREEKSKLFNMYNQIIKQIAHEIKIPLTSKEEAMLAESKTIDPEAIDEYLNGYSYAGDFSKESLFKARNYLNSAIQKDPDWALLYAALANVWYMIGGMGIESPEITLPKVYEYTNKAIELEPDLAEAHHINALLAESTEWNMERAENEFLKALAGNPNNALSRMRYSWLLYTLQRPEEAKIQANLAYRLDPLNPMIQCFYGITLSMAGDCESAMSVLENVVASDPDNFQAYNYIHPTAFKCGDLNKVFEADKHMLPLTEETINEIEKIYNERGFNAAYEDITKKLEIIAEKAYINSVDMALRYYMINQDYKALEWIEKGAEMREPSMLFIGTIYKFTRLYDNPRFIEIRIKMNLPLLKPN